MQYVFKHNYRQFRAGDAVPETWASGLVQSFLQHNRIEPAPAAKSLDAPPKNKTVKRRNVKRKAADANAK